MAQAVFCAPHFVSAQVPRGARMSYLETAEAKVGVDLNRGGAIVFLSRGGGGNLINNFDLGRQVQLSFFSGPVPFVAGDQRPPPHWEHIGWNPIQAGDDHQHPSRVLDHRNDGRTLYVRTLPMQWPLNNVPGDCTFESWLRLEGPVVVARARLNNARLDKTRYPARLQELPAAYANAPYHRVVTYAGDQPFSGAPASLAPKPTGSHPWSFWLGTEGWSALLDEHDYGLGLLTPGRVHFTGGFAGQTGPDDTHANSTGYLAGQGQEILDHNIVYEFTYELLAGSLAEIRARAATHRDASPPAWTFAQDRQGWHYVNAHDQGWPIKDALEVRLEHDDPQLWSPYTFWLAEDAPVLVIECAFHTRQQTATVFWQRHGQKAPAASDAIEFPIHPDGEFHRYEVPLASAPSYRGGIVRLRFDPIATGSPGDSVRLRSITLTKDR